MLLRYSAMKTGSMHLSNKNRFLQLYTALQCGKPYTWNITVGNRSAMTQEICGTEKRAGTFVCPCNTTTTVTTPPKYWHYYTCSGSCRGTELMGALFSTLPSIYKNNTVSPHITTLN
jgi:hypothetical protein